MLLLDGAAFILCYRAMMIRCVLVQHDIACFVNLLLTTQTLYVAAVHILLDHQRPVTETSE